MPGPPPKRSDERRRRNVPTGGPVTKLDVENLEGADDPDSLAYLIKQPIQIPEPPVADEGDPSGTRDWDPVALQMWESFKRSGQALFWEPSDWAVAYLICESISRDMKPQVVGVSPANEFGPAEVVKERIPLKGASLSAYAKMFGQLMLTEGERRRLSIELERTRVQPEKREPARVVKITDRRQAALVAKQLEEDAS